MAKTPRKLAGEPDTAPLDAPAPEPAARISLLHECPDCDWCGGRMAALDMIGSSVAVSYDPDLAAPAGAAHLVVGRDLAQAGFVGLAARSGQVYVGAPPHPLCAAVNLAHQAGFTRVEVEGAPPALGDKLRPFFDAVKDRISVTFI